MKVEVKENETEKELQFPCLMIHENGMIIIATEKRKNGYNGSVLINVNTTVNVGEHGVFNQMFKPFKGSITLSND
jgi:hypothetical protein